VAVGLLVLMMVVVEVQPAEATFPGKNGKIAYVSSDGHVQEIYTIDPRGGNRVQVTHNNTRDSVPSVSPSGKRIAYSGRQGKQWVIYTIKATGGKRVKVTKGDTPFYSPDGKRIAYSARHGKDFDIFTINVGGGGRLNVTNDRGRVRTMKIPGGNTLLLTPGDYYPTYSPDGKRIAFMGGTGFESAALFTVNVGGGSIQQFSGRVPYGDPDYSPDGRMIVATAHGGIAIIKANGGGFVPGALKGLKGGVSSACFSPDGKKIAYEGWDAKGEDWEIYTLTLGGGKPFNVTDNNINDFSPSWGSR